MPRHRTDIWAWVVQRSRDLSAAGQGSVARLLWTIPADENKHQVEQVEAMLPEGLAAARALEDPWLEVFFRHWGMQNRLNNLAQGAKALPEATALLEFAHRDETRDCPQSVCVTQDMAICYGNTDGPGYARERMDVVDETLARIDPSWQCFTCLTIEYASALEDAGRDQEALAYMEKQAAALQEAGEEVNTRFRWKQAEFLINLDRSEEALAAFDRIDNLKDEASRDDRVSRAISRSLAFSRLGRIDEAEKVLPKWSELMKLDYPRWTEALVAILRAKPDRNTWEAGTALQTAIDQLIEGGAYRKALEVALYHGELAVGRGARTTALRAVEAARGLVPQLHSPLDAPDRVEALAEKVRAMPQQAPLPVPPGELLEHLRAIESPDLEQQLEWLLSASDQCPDDAELAMVAASALAALTLKRQATDLLLAHLEREPANRQFAFGVLALGHGEAGDDLYARVVELVEPHDAALGHLARGAWAVERGNLPEAMARANAALEIDAADRDAMNLLAGAAMKAGDYALAASSWKRSLDAVGGELQPGEGWNLLAAASASQQWGLVREVAAQMGIELQGDGVVEEDWEPCVILYEEQGNERRYGAHRTGPVTARIIQPAQEGDPQHAGDWVVFDARPVDPPPDDEELRKQFWYTYRLVDLLAAGEFGDTWLLDGASPAGEAWAGLRDGIRERGWACWDVTGPDYRIADPRNPGQGLPGILVFVAAPRSVAPAELHETLTALTKGWKHPLSWLQLAEAAGKDVDRHRAIVQDYGL